MFYFVIFVNCQKQSFSNSLLTSFGRADVIVALMTTAANVVLMITLLTEPSFQNETTRLDVIKKAW